MTRAYNTGNYIQYLVITYNGKESEIYITYIYNMKYFCCYCSVTQWFPALCNPMDCSMPGFSALHHLPEFVQIHVLWVSDALHSPFRPDLHRTDPVHMYTSPKNLQSRTKVTVQGGPPSGTQSLTVSTCSVSGIRQFLIKLLHKATSSDHRHLPTAFVSHVWW